MKTYIVDDELVSIYLTKHLLIEEGFSDDITTFLSAEEALTGLLQNITENMPQVIFLDLNMPGMNGWEFLDELTSYKEQLPGCCQIYILTSSLDTSDMAKSKKYASVGGFIHKPIDKADIQEIMAHLKQMSNKSQ